MPCTNIELVLAHEDVEEPHITRLGLPVVDRGAIEWHGCGWLMLRLLELITLR